MPFFVRRRFLLVDVPPYTRAAPRRLTAFYCAILAVCACTRTKRSFCLYKTGVLRRYFPFCGKLYA